MPHIIGVDPGADGGITAMYVNGNKVQAMNTISTPYNKKKKDVEVDTLFLWMMKNSFGTIKDDVIILMEYSKSMPRQGVASMFTYGYVTGEAKACCDLLKVHAKEAGVECNVFLVTPKIWQKYTVPDIAPNLETKDRKYQHYLRMLELYPKYEKKVKGTRGGLKDGKVDSVLIAEFGRLLISSDIKNKVSKSLKDQLLEAEHSGEQTKTMINEMAKEVKKLQKYLSKRKDRKKVVGIQLARDRKNLAKMKTNLASIRKRWEYYYGDK